ncbi:hypothetical protein EQH57_0162 [Dictyocoela roeselum]|nr:hypothetical protein EQH57_0162 [Dictyocoela roeselum]
MFYENYRFREIKEKSGLSLKTVVKIITKISDHIFYKYLRSLEKIGGENEIVEVDESVLVKRKYNNGRKVKEIGVYGMVERRNQKKIIFIPISKRNSCTLCFFTLVHVKRKTKVYSDKWGGYKKLKLLGYKHKSVNHSKNFIDPTTGVHTNTIEANWSGLKRGIPVNHRRVKYLRSYLLRYMIKRNTLGNYMLELIKMI